MLSKYVKHVSASSLNLARADVALWFTTYIEGVRGGQSLPMIKGIAAEDGVTHGLFNPSATLEDCLKVARKTFAGKTTLSAFDRDDVDAAWQDIAGREAEGRKKAYPGMVNVALQALRPYGIPTKPETRQHKIEFTLEGVSVPVIGYLDYRFDQHGTDIDLKTTARLPGDMSQDHQLQGGIYFRAGGNRTQRFAYTTKSECKVLELSADAAREGLHQAHCIALRLDRLLSISEDPAEVAGLLIPDYSGFRWDEKTRAKGRGLFGF